MRPILYKLIPDGLPLLLQDVHESNEKRYRWTSLKTQQTFKDQTNSSHLENKPPGTEVTYQTERVIKVTGYQRKEKCTESKTTRKMYSTNGHRVKFSEWDLPGRVGILKDVGVLPIPVMINPLSQICIRRHHVEEDQTNPNENGTIDLCEGRSIPDTILKRIQNKLRPSQSTRYL